MMPTAVRLLSVSTSPEANATFTTPWASAWTMRARLRIVRSGSLTTIVARPGWSDGCGDDAGRGHHVTRSSG
jgi:hypothetical protein